MKILKKLVTLETLIFFQNTLQVPSDISSKITFGIIKKRLNKCNKILKTKGMFFDRKDYRKYIQPFYSSDEKISKIFYGNQLSIIAQKK